MGKLEHKKFKVLGITPDVSVCDCCGKENLKKTVAMLDLNNNFINHFGVICAGAIQKYDSLEALNEAKKEIRKAQNKFKSCLDRAQNSAFWRLKKEYGTEITEDGGLKLKCDLKILEDLTAKYLDHYLKNPLKPLDF